MQIYLQERVEAKMAWATDSSEMKRSGIERVGRTRVSARLEDNTTFLVAMRLGETPVHIPNTMVKT